MLACDVERVGLSNRRKGIRKNNSKDQCERDDQTEKEKKIININDLINKEGFLGLRGLFRLSKNGTVERSFDLKTIKNKKFIVYEKANNFF